MIYGNASQVSAPRSSVENTLEDVWRAIQAGNEHIPINDTEALQLVDSVFGPDVAPQAEANYSKVGLPEQRQRVAAVAACCYQQPTWRPVSTP
jgi:hypothetical protein